MAPTSKPSTEANPRPSGGRRVTHHCLAHLTEAPTTSNWHHLPIPTWSFPELSRKLALASGKCGLKATWTPPSFVKQAGISVAQSNCLPGPGPLNPWAEVSLCPCFCSRHSSTAAWTTAGRWTSAPTWPRLGEGATCPCLSLSHFIYRHEGPENMTSLRNTHTDGTGCEGIDRSRDRTLGMLPSSAAGCREMGYL